MLLLLGLIPLLAALYWWLLKRRRRFAVVFSDIELIRAALPEQTRWRRHLPAAVLGLALVSLLLGLTRPVAVVQIPLSKTSIILALDVSRSMCATDIEPNRLSVAQDAAVQFVESQSEGAQIGIVAFAGFAELVVPPTTDRAALVSAIEGFKTSFGTAMGSATMRSLDAISDINPAVAPAGIDLSETIDRNEVWNSEDKVADIVVVLTDGANTQGVNPLRAAEQAADRKVRVYTIGFGTTEETSMVCNPTQAGVDFIADPFGNEDVTAVGAAGDFGQSGGFGGLRQFLVIDEPTLQSVAETTGGEYFRAEDADQLVDVFANLPSQIELQSDETEITWLFAVAGALLALVAFTASRGSLRARSFTN
jgi:Ca-activated chloride channel family protein